jgi:quercetin dioxygenase-like cupin family protein
VKSVFALFLIMFPFLSTSAESIPSPIVVETLIQSASSWDGRPYPSYPAGPPQIAVLKITIAPHSTMRWHSHAIPSAGYVLSGDLTIEKKDGSTHHVAAGQAALETMNDVHRGITGASPVVLVVFYAGTSGIPLSHDEEPTSPAMK